MVPACAPGRQLATLDLLSKGRLVVGFGLGWSKDEYDALGIPMSERARLTDDHLAALNAIRADDPISFDGTGYRIPLRENFRPPSYPPSPTLATCHRPTLGAWDVETDEMP